jgi:hypothetical protein
MEGLRDRLELEDSLLSAICRAAFWPAGILVHVRVFGPDSVRGFWIEFAFRLVIGGFWGSLLQAFCAVRPAWLAGLYLAVLLPGMSLLLEHLTLRVGGASHVDTITVTSIAFSVVSLFANWGLMRKGMLLTGQGTASLVTDLRRIFALMTGLGSAGEAAQEAHSECVVRVKKRTAQRMRCAR